MASHQEQCGGFMDALAGWTEFCRSFSPASIPFMISRGFNRTAIRRQHHDSTCRLSSVSRSAPRVIARPMHTSWFVFERVPWRLQKSLSDLNGTDVYTHGGTPEGVFRTLLSAFVRQRTQPTVGQMNRLYADLRSNLRPLLRDTGASSSFEASLF